MLIAQGAAPVWEAGAEERDLYSGIDRLVPWGGMGGLRNVADSKGGGGLKVQGFKILPFPLI